MNDHLNDILRVNDRLAERFREADSERRSRVGAQRSPRLAARVAVALHGMADRLDSVPAERRGHRLAEG